MLLISNTYCFPWPQWLRERASLLRYTYIVCLAGAKLHSFFIPSLRDSTHYFLRNSKQSRKLVIITKNEITHYQFLFILFLFPPSSFIQYSV